jgi:thioredoxin-like negative regulator of GroEL
MPDLPDLVRARQLVQAELYGEAIALLKKADKTTGEKRADVALDLAVAYYRSGALKDAEATARRTLDLTDDATTLADALTLLGRVLAEGEKKRVRRDSEPLRAAEEALRRALVISGNRSEGAHIVLAETLYRLDRTEEGQQLLGQLLEKPGVTESVAMRARQIVASPRCATEPCLPAFSLTTSDGQRLTPEEFRGNVVVFSFWATWCKPCVKSVPDLKALHGSHAGEPFVMVGINADADAATADAFVAKHHVGWAQVTGEHALRVMSALSVHALPTEMVFDHEGVLVGRTTGWGSETSLTLPGRIGDALQRAKRVRSQPPPRRQ